MKQPLDRMTFRSVERYPRYGLPAPLRRTGNSWTRPLTSDDTDGMV